jgi:hypothetical protein
LRTSQAGLQVLQAFILSQGVEFIAVFSLAISAGAKLMLVNCGMLILLNIVVKLSWITILNTPVPWRWLLYFLTITAPFILGATLLYCAKTIVF